ncbi:interleukin-6 [Polymixia lowei]
MESSGGRPMPLNGVKRIKSNAFLLSAVMLGGFVLRGNGGPVGTMTTGSSGETSGDELETERPSELPTWELFIGVTKLHEKQFEEEFHHDVKYNFLHRYKIPSPPAGCPSTNFSKESCLQRVVQGLLKYMVLLKHVEEEYPSNTILPEARYNGDRLIRQVKEKMKHPERTTEMSATEEENLLEELRNDDAFQRKMTAHSVLRSLHLFLIDSKRALAKKEARRGSMAHSILGNHQVL